MKRIPIWSLILFLLPLSLLTATERLPYRISYIQGEAMVQRGYDEGFEEASINTPLVEGDRLTVENGRLEVDLGNRSYLRMDKGSDVVIGGVDRKEGRLQIDLRRGVVILALDNLDNEGDLVVELSDVEIVPLERGLYRIEATGNGEGEVIVSKGIAEVLSQSSSRYVRSSQSVTVRDGGSISRPLYAYEGDRGDSFDRWSETRSAQMRERYGRSRGYLSDELYDYENDLDQNGSWVNVPEYGRCWRPRVGYTDWRPYYNGRWTWIFPYGWTWVPYDTWGWVTYHYGRWDWEVSLGWYWIPGRNWGPAWVDWYSWDDYIGWAPLDWHGHPVIINGGRRHHDYDRIPATARSVVVLRKNSLMSRNISSVALSHDSVLSSSSLSRGSFKSLGSQPLARRNLESSSLGNSGRKVMKRAYVPVSVGDQGAPYGSNVVPKGTGGTIVGADDRFRNPSAIREKFSEKGSSTDRSSGRERIFDKNGSNDDSSLQERKSPFMKKKNTDEDKGDSNNEPLSSKRFRTKDSKEDDSGSTSSSSTTSSSPSRKIKKKDAPSYDFSEPSVSSSSSPEGEGGNNTSRRSFYRFFQKTTPSTDQGEREGLSRRQIIGTPERLNKSGESRSPYRFFTGSSGGSDDSSRESLSLRRRSEGFPSRDSLDSGRSTNSERSFWSRTKERVVFPAGNSGESPTFRRQESRSFNPFSSSSGNSVSSRSSERSQSPSRSIKKKD